MVEVIVDLGERGYSIHIGTGIERQLPGWLAALRLHSKILVVSDANVGGLYAQSILTALANAGYQAEVFIVRPGEDSKSMEMAMQLYTKAIEMGLERQSSILALGGGVVGDLAGFVAATYLRGVPFIQIPTSLLAQVDSSVGGKVAVNHKLGKNLIGAFYQPKFVAIDTGYLDTLPLRELSSGMAEVIKYGVIVDKEFFEFLEDNHSLIMARNANTLVEAIRISCQSKAGVVTHDERESGERIILNFGHTIAHAIEAGTGFARYNHGEAVAIGMHGAALLSHYLGLCSKACVERLCKLLAKYQLPLTAPGCDIEQLLAFIHRDKKSSGGKVNWVLMQEVGQVAVSSQVPEDLVRRVLAELV